jgi:hypothetical protein
MHDATTMISSSINSIGISSLEARSIPLRTPFSMIRYVATRIMNVQNTGLTGSCEKVVK